LTDHVIRIADERIAFRFKRRSLVVALAIILATLIGAVVALCTGDYPLSPGEVFATLIGNGDPGSAFIVETLRLPRLTTGILVGAALGISGAIFQRITHNPLGSPDVIGFTTGSATGALLAILLFDAGPDLIAVGAVAGGAISAILVYLLAMRGGVQGYRLVLVGIGIGAMLIAANDYLLTRAHRDDAYAAARWLLGSLNDSSWGQAVPVAIALAVLVPLALLLVRRMDMLEMGDDAARALGVNVGRSTFYLSVVGVLLCGVGVAATGPIAFVALTAPQLARRLTRSPGPGLVTSALMGSLVIVLSDVAAINLSPKNLPIGVVTGLVGGVYLAFLLASEWRKR